MSHELCPRQIVFTVPGAPGVQISATEVDGNIVFTVDVTDPYGSSGDLRGLFFHLDESELSGLTITNADPLLAEWQAGANSIIDLGKGANMHGAVKTGFDVGLEWGTPGGSADDINFPVSFTLENSTGDLTLDDLGGMLFGARLDSIGGPGGQPGSSSKLTTIAPFAPDAIDDSVDMYEDGASGLDDPSKDPAAVVIDVTYLDHAATTPILPEARAAAFETEVAYFSRSRHDVPYRYIDSLTALAEWCDVLIVAVVNKAFLRKLIDFTPALRSAIPALAVEFDFSEFRHGSPGARRIRRGSGRPVP